jgi:hypothetical protein
MFYKGEQMERFFRGKFPKKFGLYDDFSVPGISIDSNVSTRVYCFHQEHSKISLLKKNYIFN